MAPGLETSTSKADKFQQFPFIFFGIFNISTSIQAVDKIRPINHEVHPAMVMLESNEWYHKNRQNTHEILLLFLITLSGFC